MTYNWWISSLILLVLGGCFAIVAVIMKQYGKRGERNLKHTEARVVDIVAEPRTGDFALSEFKNRQAAVFEFYAEGKLFKVTDKKDTYPCPYYLNQRVKIRYNPENPEEFSVVYTSKWDRASYGMNYLSIICVLFGCLFFLMHAARVEL